VLKLTYKHLSFEKKITGVIPWTPVSKRKERLKGVAEEKEEWKRRRREGGKDGEEERTRAQTREVCFIDFGD
jgi:hypothetical protein